MKAYKVKELSSRQAKDIYSTIMQLILISSIYECKTLRLEQYKIDEKIAKKLIKKGYTVYISIDENEETCPFTRISWESAKKGTEGELIYLPNEQ